MTSNQIAYAQHREGVRHNLATETETYRSNVAKEAETNRHNVATEKEASRHNIVTENETSRHNVAQEQLGWSQLQETNRHNLAAESIGMESNAINRLKNQISQSYLEMDKKYYDIRNAQIQSQTQKLDTETSYMGQENARDWIDTVVGNASNAWKAVTSTWKIIGD